MATKPEIAWAAGLFEGEGTWLSRGGSAQAALSSTDRDVVERFAEVVGFGRVREQKAYGGGHVRSPTTGKPHKPQYVWGVSNATQVRQLIKLLRPWLGERRRAKADSIWEATANTKRGGSKYATHCKFGHLYNEENTGWHTGKHPNGKSYTTRYCKRCRRVK